ncbi:MAG: hypothetical protein ACREVV_03105 [Steroidobacteraceae bacterium]
MGSYRISVVALVLLAAVTASHAGHAAEPSAPHYVVATPMTADTESAPIGNLREMSGVWSDSSTDCRHLAERKEDREARLGELRERRLVDIFTVCLSILTLSVLALTLRGIIQQAKAANASNIISQSESFFQHAQQCYEDAFKLLDQTRGTDGYPDPNRRNLENWDRAARLIKGAQALRSRMSPVHARIFDVIVRDVSARRFAALLKLPGSFSKQCFTQVELQHLPQLLVRQYDPNEYIREQPLAVIYRFARQQDRASESVDGEPAFNEALLPSAHHPVMGTPGVAEYISVLRELESPPDIKPVLADRQQPGGRLSRLRWIMQVVRWRSRRI